MADETRDLNPPIPSGIGETCSLDKTGSQTSAIIESTTDWTDEKHSLYLNSIEESFVNQLYGHGYHLSDSYDWFSRAHKEQLPSGSKMNTTFSGQFKVQTRGCWEEIKFERTRPRDIKIGSHATTANPWIRHFRSPRAGRQRHERPCFDGTESFSKQLPCRSMKIHYQDSVGRNAEVSDQNFAEND